ncbi:MAG TPA: hypothetical protein VNT79_02055 [Phycisphaerae bacterium]|nr:hypothetical protein [Phycisphaerae bacterium]
MNPREKRLAIIVGVFGGAYLGWLGVNSMIFGARDTALKERERFAQRYNELKKLKDEKYRLEQVWRADAARTFSFEETVAKDMLERELKTIAARHGFDRPSVKNAAPLRVGYQSQIRSRATSVTVSGDYGNSMAFLRDIYDAPFLCQVTSVTVTPLGGRMGRNNVKMDMVVETPVLPETIKGVEFSEPLAVMPENPAEPLTPFRKGVLPESELALLLSRNILKEFMPAPVNVVMIDNLDRKMVGVKGTFSWEGKTETQFTKGVEGKKQVSVEGKGNLVELTIAYADGETLGPIKHEFAGSGTWSYKIPSHTPAPPPEYINLAVDNKHAEDVLVNVTIKTPDGKEIRPPTMLIEASKVIDLGEWEAKEIQVTAKYKSQKPAPGGTYSPSETKQTLMIPPEPAEVLPQPDAVDPPADERFTVAGLWTYRDVQEMIVTSPEGRTVITAGQEAAVDGGTLLAVHPLGGVVQMPATGNYYLYPLGQSYGKRVWLEVEDEEQLASAIDKWARK